MQDTRDLIDKLDRDADLADEEWRVLIGRRKTISPENRAFLEERARSRAREHYGWDIYLRGLIEFTNCCRNNCLYCGIRRDNRELRRYRLTKEEILACADTGYRLSFRTVVLQGGEDPAYTDEDICDIVRSIKDMHPDMAVTLSIGEKERESCQRYFDAGADRYLLRHETADFAHYRRMHPPELSLRHRMACLFALKEIGYQIGAGFMVGSPLSDG